MSFGKILHLGLARSLVIEFFFKPAVTLAAFALYPWIMWASPLYSHGSKEIVASGYRASLETWPKDTDAMTRWKTGLYINLAGHFFAADNAYECWFNKFIQIHAEKLGYKKPEVVTHGPTQKGKKKTRKEGTETALSQGTLGKIGTDAIQIGYSLAALVY